MKRSQPSMYKGITTEGPNKLNRKGKPLKPKRKKARKINPDKNVQRAWKLKKLLSINSNSKLRNQLASLRQSTRPIVNNIPSNDRDKYRKRRTRKKNNALVQHLQWHKVKASPVSFGKLTRRSLLFSIEEMKNIDKITIYYIGKCGLDELCELDEIKFSKYKIMNLRDLNSNQIISLLADLSDYFLFSQCHKLLEFLICYHKIHLNYPVFALRLCLPYFATNTFVRFIQLLEFNNYKWQLLFHNVCTELVPMHKETLINQCFKDFSILQFVQEMYHNNNDNNSAPSMAVNQLYVDILLNMLNLKSTPPTNKLLLQIMPHLTGKHMKNAENLMILNWICSKVHLNKEQFCVLLKCLIANISDNNEEEVNQRLVLSIDYMLSSQHIHELSEDIVAVLCTTQIFKIVTEVRGKFMIKLAVFMIKQLIFYKMLRVNELLFMYKFDEDIICNEIFSQLQQNEITQLKIPSNYNELLCTPTLINVLNPDYNYENLQNIICKYAQKTEVIKIIIDKIVERFNEKQLNNHQMTDLLMVCLKHCPVLNQKVFDILFDYKLLLVNQRNVIEIVRHIFQIKAIENTCNFFEFVCLCVDICGDNEILTMNQMNVAIINILSNNMNMNKNMENVNNLLHILNRYKSRNILINANKSDININNLLQNIGENMSLNAGKFGDVISCINMSMHSKLLLLLSLKQIIAKKNSNNVIHIFLQITSNINLNRQQQNKQIMALICNIFNLCIQNISAIKQQRDIFSILIRNLSKHNAINDTLLQMFFHHYGKQPLPVIKLLLPHCNNNSKCLYLLSVLLQKHSLNSYKSEIYNILSVILLNLNSANKSVRFAGVECVRNLSKYKENKLLIKLIAEINDFAADIIEDRHTLHRIFCCSLQAESIGIIKLLYSNTGHSDIINYQMLKLFIPIIRLNYKKNEETAAVKKVCSNILKYRALDSKCCVEICKLLETNLIPFKYVNKWISKANSSHFDIIPLLTNTYWKNLRFASQKKLYTNMEKLFEENNSNYKIKEKIVEFVLKVELSKKMIEYLLQKNDKTIMLMTRIQFVISKINNNTISNANVVNQTLIPLIMALLKETHLKINNIQITNKKIEVDADAGEGNGGYDDDDDDLNNVDIDDFIVYDDDNDHNQRNKAELNELKELNWLRCVLLSLLINIFSAFGDKLIGNAFDCDTLISCMQFEWIFKSQNNLFIELVCYLGKYLPKLLLKIYVPFITFLSKTPNMNATANKMDVIFLSLLTDFFKSTIGAISAFLDENELKNVVESSIFLFDKFADNKLEIKFISLLMSSLIKAHKNVVHLTFSIMETKKDINFYQQILFNASNNDIKLQLNIIANMIENQTMHYDLFFLRIICNHLKHSDFISKFSTIIIANNDVIPMEIDKLTGQIFKQLFEFEHTEIINEILDNIRGLLSLESFAFIIRDLIFDNDKNNDLQLQLQLLKDQIHQKSQKFKLNDVKCYVKEIVIPLFDNVLFQKQSKTEINQHVLCILDITIRRFHKYPMVNGWFFNITQILIDQLQTNSDNKIKSHLLLLLSSIVNALHNKQSLLSSFSKMIKMSLEILSGNDEKDELLMIASTFCLECVMREYHNYIGPFLDDILECILGAKFLHNDYNNCRCIRIYIRKIFGYISSFNSDKLIKSLKKTFIKVSRSGSMICYKTYFKIISSRMDLWKTRNQTIAHYKSLFDLFKYCMAICCDNYVDKELVVILNCFSSLVLKLTDGEMMKIIEKLIFWVEEFDKNSLKYNIRTLCLFRFLSLCLQKFKGTFCKISLFCFGLAINCLLFQTGDQNDNEPANKKQKQNDGTSKIINNFINRDVILIKRANYIMETIKLTLRYGLEERIIDKATYLMLLPIVVGEIKYGVAIRDELMYIRYFEKYITPTIVCLANTTKDIHLWNELNKRILLLCGHRNCMVRSASVDALLALFSLMGHAWLNCLPQTLQHINELMQDDNPDVLQRTQSLVQRIELITQSKLNNLT